ncbi:unnamed protein product, partial [Ixodes pacificus]
SCDQLYSRLHTIYKEGVEKASSGRGKSYVQSRGTEGSARRHSCVCVCGESLAAACASRCMSRCCLRHLMRRFWNHTLTCASVSRRAAARYSRSGPTMYCWRSNSASSRSSWSAVKMVRTLRARGSPWRRAESAPRRRSWHGDGPRSGPAGVEESGDAGPSPSRASMVKAAPRGVRLPWSEGAAGRAVVAGHTLCIAAVSESARGRPA